MKYNNHLYVNQIEVWGALGSKRFPFHKIFESIEQCNNWIHDNFATVTIYKFRGEHKIFGWIDQQEII